MDPAPPVPDACVSCAQPLKPGSNFCAHCGHPRGDPPVDRAAKIQARIEHVRKIQTGWGGIRSAILLYVGLLGGQFACFVVISAMDQFAGEVASSAVLAAIVLLAAFMHRATLSHLGGPGFGVQGYGLVLLLAVPIVIVVHLYVIGVSKILPIKVQGYLDPFEGRSAAWAYLLVAAAPAVFEELVFRGVMFGLLRRALHPRETILLSAIAFGLLHLSVPMLLTHVPLGIYLGVLRHRSGSLYPSMVAHFLHNGLVVTAEAWLLFPRG